VEDFPRFVQADQSIDGVKNLGWKFYIVWAVLNLANAIIVWLFYPETGGQPLEAVDALFIESDPTRRSSSLGLADAGPIDVKKGILGKLQWSVVRKADAQVKAYKRTSRRRISESTLTGDMREEEVAKD
jgi:hypothetical protein